MSRFFLSLGSNVGDRAENLSRAVALLRSAGLAIDCVSSSFETEPVGAAAGPRWFLNMALGGESDLAPEEILAHCARVERAMGRERTVPGGPRSIDIDLLLAGEAVVRSDTCEVPHPRMHLRRFVLAPLAEIAGEAVHPRLGRTVAELLSVLDDRTEVRRVKPAGDDLSPAVQSISDPDSSSPRVRS